MRITVKRSSTLWMSCVSVLLVVPLVAAQQRGAGADPAARLSAETRQKLTDSLNGAAAYAVTLTTPPLSAGSDGTAQCEIVNVGQAAPSGTIVVSVADAAGHRQLAHTGPLTPATAHSHQAAPTDQSDTSPQRLPRATWSPGRKRTKLIFVAAPRCAITRRRFSRSTRHFWLGSSSITVPSTGSAALTVWSKPTARRPSPPHNARNGPSMTHLSSWRSTYPNPPWYPASRPRSSARWPAPCPP